MLSVNIISKQIHFATLLLCGGSVSVYFYPYLMSLHTYNGFIALFLLSIALNIEILTNRVTSNIEKVYKTFFYVGCVEILVSILQIFQIFPSFNYFCLFTGTFCNSVVLAMYLSLCIPIGVYFYIQSNNTEKNIWGLMTLTVCLTLLITGSRTGFITMLCTFVIFFKKNITRRFLSLKNKNIGLFFLFVLLAIMLYTMYLYKADSVKGRLLIWTVAFEMIKENPILGWGSNGFDCFYMIYQAEYLKNHPYSPYIMLASEINNPFNEFLLIGIKYGLISIIVLIIIITIIIRRICRLQSHRKSLLLSIIISLILWSMFSYPYRELFIILVSFFVLGSIFPIYINRKVFCWVIFSLGAFSIITLFPIAYYKYSWFNIQKQSQNENQEMVLDKYYELYNHLKNETDFLYNYSVILYINGLHERSLLTLQETLKLCNDYNVQMLLADNYRKIGKYEKALQAYKLSNMMVPHKFLPLYYQMEIFKEIGNYDKMKQIAGIILSKKVRMKSL